VRAGRTQEEPVLPSVLRHRIAASTRAALVTSAQVIIMEANNVTMLNPELTTYERSFVKVGSEIDTHVIGWAGILAVNTVFFFSNLYRRAHITPAAAHPHRSHSLDLFEF
jgi:hypothetical protein